LFLGLFQTEIYIVKPFIMWEVGRVAELLEIIGISTGTLILSFVFAYALNRIIIRPMTQKKKTLLMQREKEWQSVLKEAEEASPCE
jgi:prolipoprotein diacylglyceryltransferase